MIVARCFAMLLCSFATATAMADAADRAAIEAAAQRWTQAFNTRDIVEMLSSTSDDVILLDPNSAPSQGHDGARDAWQKAMKRSNLRLSNKTREITVSNDVAWRVATFMLAADDVTTSTSALEVWKRVDGRWKLHRQMSAGVLSRTLVRPQPTEPRLDTPTN